MAEPSFQFDLEKALDQQPQGMLRDPFGVKDAAYFATETRNQQLAMLEHLSRYSNMLLVVEGAQGSGKTAFMKEFAHHQKDNALISEVHGSMLMTAGQLLSSIYKGFDDVLGHIKPDSTFGPLLTFAQDKEQSGQVALVLIDNAQELNTDAIIMLLDMVSMASEHQATPHVVLFTEQSLQRNLDSFQRNRFEQLSHQQTLQPLTLEQTNAYLLHRVRSISGEINLPFSDKQVKQLHKVSAGYPGRINKAAQAQLGIGQSAATLKQPKFNLALGFPLVHMAGLSIAMIAILLAVIFNDTETPTPEVSRGSVIPLAKDNVQNSVTMERIEAMQKRLVTDQAPLSLPPIPKDTLVTERRSPTTQIAGANTQTTSPVQAAPTVQSAPINLSAPAVTPPTLSTRLTVPSLSSAVSVAAPPTVPTTEVSASEERDPFEKTAWWLTQNPNRYTLQLLGTYNESTVNEFIRDQGSLEGFSYFQAIHNNRDWYVVVYGSFRNRSEAIAAVENLPRDLQSLNPWARSVRGIQDDIRKAQ